MNNRYSTLKSQLLLFLLLFSSGFMGYVGINSSSIYYSGICACLAIAALLLPSKKSFHYSAVSYGVIAFISVIYFSFITGLVYGGQTVYYSFRGAFGLLYVPIFFYVFLIKESYTTIEIKKCLITIFAIYLVVYAYSYLIFPNVKFASGGKEVYELIQDFQSRGVMRLAIPFEDLITLGVLYFINNPHKNKAINILILVFLFVLTFLRGTRSVMLATFIVSAMLFLKQSKNKTIGKIIGLCIVLGFVYLIYELAGFSSIMDNYMDNFERDSDLGGDYIRWVMAGYYLTRFNSSIGEYVFGHGIPTSGDFQQRLMNDRNLEFYPDDIGYIELFLNFGLLGIIILLFILCAVIKKPVEAKDYYAKYYIYYLFLTTFLGRYILSNIALFAIMLYIVERSQESRSLQRRYMIKEVDHHIVDSSF